VKASDPQNLPVYRFGAFELDCARRELRKNGEIVPIQPKAFELLRYLVEHRDRAIDKEELQDALWPRSIVTETSLTRSVMKARRAVGDDSGQQAVIRTVHGHGYRFVAAIDEGEQQAEPEAPAAAPERAADTPAPGRRRSWVPSVAIAVVLVAAIAWWGSSRDADSAPIRVAVLPVVNATGDPDLEWVTTGLMSLVNRLLQDHGVGVVAERRVLSLVEAGGELAATLAKTERATHLLESQLGFEDGIYRLEFSVRRFDGRADERTAVANEPAGMVPAVAESVARLLAGGRYTDLRRRTVSDDPFINEAYARALSLEFAGRLEEAKRLFQVVIEQDPELFWPRYEYALCARNLREWDVAAPLLDELIAEARSEGAIAEQAAAINSLGVLHYSRDEFDAARGLFEEVRRLAETIDDFDRLATAYVNLGLIARATGDIGLASTYLHEAIEIYDAEGVESLPGALTNNLSGVLIQQGHFDEAERYSRDAIANFRLMGNRLYEASSLSRLSTVLRHQGRLDEAEETQQLALAVRTELGSDVGRMSSYLNLAAIASERGDLTRARQYAEQGHDIAVDLEDRLGTAMALTAIAEAERRLGTTDAAVQGFSAAAGIYADLGDKAGELAALRGLARSRLTARDPDGARAIADELLAVAVERNRRYDEARALALLGETHLASRRPDDAVRSYGQAKSIAAELDDRRLEAEAVEGLAHAYLDLEQPVDAEPLVLRLAELRPASANTARLAARLAYLQGDFGQAVAEMERAREGAGETWSSDDAERLAQYRSMGLDPITSEN
jgi:DNA-binding winged helix-turn-helix (wHTH) protein/tetratricopeptide (TPR) repeat protein